MADLSYAQRFRFNNMTQTYAKYQDMWRKKLAQKEAGVQQHHFGAAAKAIEAERARRAASNAVRGRRHGYGGSAKTPDAARGSGGVRDVVSDPAHEHKKIEELYQKLIEARTETGEKAGAPSLKDFEGFVRQENKGSAGQGRP